jgi:hypothetical protein
MFGVREGREQALHEIGGDPNKTPPAERAKTMWRKRFVWRLACRACIVDHIVQGCAPGVVACRAAHSFFSGSA